MKTAWLPKPTLTAAIEHAVETGGTYTTLYPHSQYGVTILTLESASLHTLYYYFSRVAPDAYDPREARWHETQETANAAMRLKARSLGYTIP